MPMAAKNSHRSRLRARPSRRLVLAGSPLIPDGFTVDLQFICKTLALSDGHENLSAALESFAQSSFGRASRHLARKLRTIDFAAANSGGQVDVAMSPEQTGGTEGGK